jgi:four helix bundle protein
MYKLQDLEVFQLSIVLADNIWELVLKWKPFIQDTVGKQMVRAADSISSNIAEGYARFSLKENKQFCMYSRGSIMEIKNWLIKCRNRNLVSESQFEDLIAQLETIHRKLNAYIGFISKSQKRFALEPTKPRNKETKKPIDS